MLGRLSDVYYVFGILARLNKKKKVIRKNFYTLLLKVKKMA